MTSEFLNPTGTLHAGPAPDGGFCVDATLPAYVPTAASARS
jgi:hypothetical protein